MEEDTDRSPRFDSGRVALGWSAALVLALSFHTAQAAGSVRHFALDAGDATIMLNEFSRQSDLQVLFDFNILRGMKTRAVTGDLEASDALTSMLAGTNLTFDFVNDRTLAVTARPKKPSLLRRVLRRISNRPKPPPQTDGFEQVLISSAVDSSTLPLLGAQTISLSRQDIEHSGLATTQDFLRTLPQVFGGGPSQDTQLIGREATTNSARGDGINLRGLNAGATLVLIDGKRIAPSGTEGAFQDVSNIPLSAVDRIDVLPDATAAQYGADAMGGVVNFVMRSDFVGALSQARIGHVTDGSLGERQFSQLLGNRWDSGSGTLAFEYYQKDALRAQDRAQQTNDLRPFGGTNFDQPFGSPGTITNGLQYWAIPKGQNGTALTAARLVAGGPNLYDQHIGDDVTPDQSRWSAFGSAKHSVNDTISVFAEGLITRRRVENIQVGSLPLILSVPRSNPYYVNPAGGTENVTVLYGTASDFGPPLFDTRITTGNFALGTALALTRGWNATAYAGYTFESQHELNYGAYDASALAAALADPDPATAFNPFGDGSHTNPQTLSSISRAGLYELQSRVRSANLSAAGPVLPLPGGDVHVTVGAEYRRQSFDTYAPAVTGVANYNPRTNLNRTISAGFAELRVPLVGPQNALRFMRRLELSLGGRYEDYSDVGGSPIPKVGLTWSPAQSLGLRSTWTQAFRPPDLPDLVANTSFSALERLPDPNSPSGLTTALLRYGTNPDLQMERTRTWTLGSDIAPPSIPGALLSLTYFNIRYSGRIDQASISPDVLQRPDLAWLVDRSFTAAQLNAACSGGVYQGVPGSCAAASVTAIIDNRLRNIALLETNGLDVIGKYGFGNALGKFGFGLNATYLFKYSQANTPGSPLTDVLSTQNYPTNFRFRGSMALERRGFGIFTSINFDNSYRDTLSVPNRKVSSWTTVDMQLSYEPNSAYLKGIEHVQISVNARNLFDAAAPFLNNPLGIGYDQENAELLGRVVSLDVRKRW